MEDRITLNKRYEIIDKIGDGGMAEVFHGFDNVLHRDVSIKILRDQYLQDKNFVARFKQEAYAAASLSHPNIVNVYDVGEEHGIHYIVLEYIVGRSLKECIESNGPLDYKTAIKYAKGIASALNHAHNKNLVHCDVKSHNILIDTKGVAKITDFGIAKAVGQSNIIENKKEVMGSVYYLAPEQATGGKVSPQSDVYSLGVVLFEMLTGNLPYKGETPAEVARQHLECPTPSVCLFDEYLPATLGKIVDKALAKNRFQRYGSAIELYHDLEQAESLLYSDEDNTKRVIAPLEDKNKLSEQACVGDETMIVKKDDILRGLSNNERQTENPAPSKPKTKKVLLIFTAVLLVLAGMIYGISEYSKASIEVPNLQGKTIVEAEEMLTSLNLNYILSEEFNAEIKSGQICKQKPPAGSKVKEGRKILLVISKGAEPGKVPDVTKKNLGEATVILRNAQLEVGKVTVKYDKNAAQGIVLEQSVNAGNMVKIGSKIDLVVNISEGQTVIPSLSGMSLEAAKETLDSLGLKLGQVLKADSGEKAGTIISMEQSSGKVVEKGTAINITVSSGDDKAKAEAKKKAEEAAKAAAKKAEDENKKGENSGEGKNSAPITKIMEFVVPGKGKHSVKLVLSDDSSSRTIYTGYVDGGARIRQTITSHSGNSVQFYVDDKQVEDKRL